MHAEYFCDVMFMLAFRGRLSYVYCSVTVKRILFVNASTADHMI